jgi:hypothetical protein
LQVVIQIINALHLLALEPSGNRVGGTLPAIRHPLLLSAFQHFNFSDGSLAFNPLTMLVIKTEIRKTHFACLNIGYCVLAFFCSIS